MIITLNIFTKLYPIDSSLEHKCNISCVSVWTLLALSLSLQLYSWETIVQPPGQLCLGPVALVPQSYYLQLMYQESFVAHIHAMKIEESQRERNYNSRPVAGLLSSEGAEMRKIKSQIARVPHLYFHRLKKWLMNPLIKTCDAHWAKNH